MSITGPSADTSKLHKKSFHRRNDSDELDVFEAARYFSGYNEAASGYNNGATYTQKILRDHSHRHPWRGGRMSLDLPMTNPLPQQTHHAVEKQVLKEKKFKQPSSPGGRLASFLNSLFNQTNSKKKKSKSATQKDIDDDDGSPGGRRRRRSSVSHFRSSTTADTKSIYSSSSSGFRTPPPYANTTTKSYKDCTTYSDHKQSISLAKQNGNAKSTGFFPNQEPDERNKTEMSWIDERIKTRDGNNRYSYKGRNWVDRYPSEEKEFRKFSVEDDGGESDSSSDLFELQNYDLGIYSSDLPVYETTQMDSIRRVVSTSCDNL